MPMAITSTQSRLFVVQYVLETEFSPVIKLESMDKGSDSQSESIRHVRVVREQRVYHCCN